MQIRFSQLAQANNRTLWYIQYNIYSNLTKLLCIDNNISGKLMDKLVHLANKPMLWINIHPKEKAYYNCNCKTCKPL